MEKMILCIAIFLTSYLSAEVLQREGKGFLEKKQEQLIVHLKGSPYEMGYQQGVLLRPIIRKIVAQFIDGKKVGIVEERFQAFEKVFPNILQYIPKAYLEEMEGLARGSDIALEKIQRLNLFPELFHCAGIVALPETTKNGNLYHARVLDYKIGEGLEKASVLMVVEPEDSHAFLHLSYAGFLGVITGMNEKKISLGEIGGLGYGRWEGCPMSFLMRSVLEKASTLEEAKAVFSETKRTCEYYYLIADGKSGEAISLYTTPQKVDWILPGNSYSLIQNPGVETKEKIVLSPYTLKAWEGLTVLYDHNEEIGGVFFEQPKNSLLMTGYPKPERYPVLFTRFMEKTGHIDLSIMQDLIKPPVTCETNLHNAIFETSTLQVSISHASGKEPASMQKYHTYSWEELFVKD
jgi:hypothetical protein